MIWIENIILGYIMFCYLMQIFEFIKFLIKRKMNEIFSFKIGSEYELYEFDLEVVRIMKRL